MAMPRWMQVVSRALAPVTQPTPRKVGSVAPVQTQLTFVQVDPANAQREAPKMSKYYSAQNTFAANPNVTKPSTVPDIRGGQENYLKTTDNGKPKAQPLQPKATPTPAVKPQVAVTASAPKKKYTPGNMASAKPVETAHDTDASSEAKKEAQAQIEVKPQPVYQRPRTIAEAMERSGMPGQQTQQAGGVNRVGITSALDVTSSVIGEYDKEFVDAVSERWNQLWEGHSPNGTGKVVLQFRLHPDGRITEMTNVQSEVSELMSSLCQQAIMDPAPFKPWPRAMRLEIPADYRDIQFTFYYELQ